MQPFSPSPCLKRAHRVFAISGRNGMAGRSTDCPACGAPVDDAWCPSCGLELGGEEADALRDLASQLAAAEAELNVAWARRSHPRRVPSPRPQHRASENGT